MIKSAELPRANVWYQSTNDYGAVCIMSCSIERKYAVFAVRFNGMQAIYEQLTSPMGIKQAREALIDYARLEKDLAGNLHLVEWNQSRLDAKVK